MKGIGKRSDTKKSSRSVIEDNLIRFELRSGARNTVICSALLIILGVIGFCLGIKDAYLAIRIISIISFIAGVMIFVSGIILMMRRRNNLFKYIERFSFGVNNSIKAAVLSFHDPITVVNENWNYTVVQQEIFGAVRRKKSLRRGFKTNFSGNQPFGFPRRQPFCLRIFV